MGLKCLWNVDILYSLESVLDLLLLWKHIWLGCYWHWKLVMKTATSQNNSKYSLVYPLHQKNMDCEQKLVVLWSTCLKTWPQNWLARIKTQKPSSVCKFFQWKYSWNVHYRWWMKLIKGFHFNTTLNQKTDVFRHETRIGPSPLCRNVCTHMISFISMGVYSIYGFIKPILPHRRLGKLRLVFWRFYFVGHAYFLVVIMLWYYFS